MVYKLNEKKNVRIPDTDIERLVRTMQIDEEEAIKIWLEDEGYLINEEQEALCKAAKENKVLPSLHRAKETEKPVKKTQRERVQKENPTKEMIIAEIAKILPEFADNIVIENKGKLITFTVGENEFKLDLVQKRAKKEVK